MSSFNVAVSVVSSTLEVFLKVLLLVLVMVVPYFMLVLFVEVLLPVVSVEIYLLVQSQTDVISASVSACLYAQVLEFGVMLELTLLAVRYQLVFQSLLFLLAL